MADRKRVGGGVLHIPICKAVVELECRHDYLSTEGPLKRSRLSIARVMAAVLVIAIDLAILRTGYIDLGLLLMVPLLQIGLFRMISSRGGVRPYWLGFEVFGWAGVLAFWLGLSTPCYRLIESTLIAMLQLIGTRRPDVARAIGSMVLDDSPLSFITMSLLFGSPLLVLALLGGRLVARRASKRGKTPRSELYVAAANAGSPGQLVLPVAARRGRPQTPAID